MVRINLIKRNVWCGWLCDRGHRGDIEDREWRQGDKCGDNGRSGQAIYTGNACVRISLKCN